MTARSYLLKLIRMRKRIMAMNRSKKNTAKVHRAISELKNWLDFYPNASEKQVIHFLREHTDQVHTLIPGKGSPAQESLIEQLNTYLYGKQAKIDY